MSKVLTLAFVEATRDDDWMNRLTAGVSQHPLCHVELFFPTINQCFSILSGERATMRPKTLANPNYRLVTLAVSEKEYNTCMQFCITACSWELSFDESGMWRSVLCAPFHSCYGRRSQDVGRTFCSKIITEALQFAEIHEAHELNSSLTTPSKLYQAVTRSNRIVCDTVPFKAALLCPEKGSIRM
jgi:hypothetical protein